MSNIVADHDTGAMINVGGGVGGWQLLELRQGKPGWISEESADRAADVHANVAVGEEVERRFPTLMFVPPKDNWMMRGK